MRRWLTAFLLLPSMMLTTHDAAGVEPHSPTKFEPEIRKFELQDSQTPPPQRPVLFVGSSSIRLWTNVASEFPQLPVLNRGFGGSTMADLQHYFDRVVMVYRPGIIVLYAGDNELAGGASPEAVAASFKLFIDRVALRLPGTAVVLLAVKPSPGRYALIGAQRDLNARLLRFAATRPRVTFCDTFSPILTAAGEPDPQYFQPDQLHLNPAGYAVWKPMIALALAPLTAVPAKP
jgi:lysophospholipase L1-like esterase